MKQCPICGQTISLFTYKHVKCALCRSEFCTRCEKEFRSEPRNTDEFPLCRKCYREMEKDEVIGLEVTCPKCSKQYLFNRLKIQECRCGDFLDKNNGTVRKIIIFSCPQCDTDVDPFNDRLMNCVLCGEMFCTTCESKYRSGERGEGLFPLCVSCYSGLRHETVMLTIRCEKCGDEFTFFDPSKITRLHGEVIRLKDPFPVRCKCGSFHGIEGRMAHKVKLGVQPNMNVSVIIEHDELEELLSFADEKLVEETNNRSETEGAGGETDKK